MSQVSEKLLTPEDAAARLQVSPSTVRKWLRNGAIKGTKLGGGKLWRISESSIDEFIESVQDTEKQTP